MCHILAIVVDISLKTACVNFLRLITEASSLAISNLLTRIEEDSFEVFSYKLGKKTVFSKLRIQ